MVRWGIIGCGKVTEVKSGPGLQRAAGSSLVAVMRRDAEKARDYAERHGVPNWYADADALIHDPQVDAVYVATPPSSHADYVLRVARAGKPVYVEKPMARTAAECRAMLDACRAAEVPLFVAYYRRALPRFLKVKALLEDGAIGAARCVNVRLVRPAKPSDGDPAQASWYLTPAISGGGYLFDIGSHMLDLLDFLLGPIAEVHGAAANQAGLYAAEDLVTSRFTFASGVQGVGLWCFTAFNPGVPDMVEITGDRGRISYSTFSEVPVTLDTPRGTEYFAIPNPPHIQQPLIQTIVNALHGGPPAPSTGETALRTSWVLEEMVRGYRVSGS